MQTIQINNPTLLSEEAKNKVALTIEEVKNGTANLLSQDEYDEDINEFMKSL